MVLSVSAAAAVRPCQATMPCGRSARNGRGAARALALAVLGLATLARAETLPLWEAGVLGAVISAPDYPASNERQTVALPFPYFVYRGPIVRSDEKGLLRGRIFRSERAEIDISLAGSI